MAAILVALTVMAILMTVAMPTWRQLVRREKEAELVFRGEQYARAIGLFQRKAGPGVLPPDIDVLVEQRYLRRAYKDPVTNDDFDLLRANAAPRAVTPGGQVTNRPAAPGEASISNARDVGGIMGVASKSKDASIRSYKGASHYNEWQFVFVPPAQGPGQPGTGGAPGQGRGGRENQSGRGGSFQLGGGRGGPDGRGGSDGRGGRGFGPGRGFGQAPPPR
jgi:type II secretory pathway pseudopilin PulG